MVHDPTYVRIFKIVETIEIDSRMVVIRLEGEGNEELLFNGYSFSYARLISFRDLLYNIAPVVNNNALFL